MNPILKNILAVISGIIAGSAVNMGIISISGSVITPPEGADVTTMEGLQAAMGLFEPKHFIMPFLAHAVGTLAGAFLAALIAANHNMKFALGIGAYFMLGGIANVLMLPSPLWFTILDLGAAYIPMGYVACKLAVFIFPKFFRSKKAEEEKRKAEAEEPSSDTKTYSHNAKPKKIAIISSIVAFAACFMPFISMGVFSFTIMGLIETSIQHEKIPEIMVFPIMTIVSFLFLYKDYFKLAKFSFFTTLFMLVYYTFLMDGAPGVDIVNNAGIGYYLILLTSISGIIFSKE